jgi:hypothetical protein
MSKLDFLIDMMHRAIQDGHVELAVLASDQGAKENLMEKIESGLWSRGWVMEKRVDELRVVGKARIRFVIPHDQLSCGTG